jgi:signal peptidase I
MEPNDETVVEPGRKSTGREYYEALLIAIVFVNFARVFLFQAFKIPTASMVDNLLVGDHILVNKFIFGAGARSAGSLVPMREIRRGDVVVFRHPNDPAVDYVKRVIGLPGETIHIRDKVVHVDGRPAPEPYVLHRDPNVYPFDPELVEPYRSRDQFGPYRVPPGSYFVMGDNRDLSHDSRYWGTVPRELIKGKALLVYWSFEGRPLPASAPAGQRLKELLTVAIRFFPDTRWDRTFYIVDSKYHYHARGTEH